jgi:hypothetical protein
MKGSFMINFHNKRKVSIVFLIISLFLLNMQSASANEEKLLQQNSTLYVESVSEPSNEIPPGLSQRAIPVTGLGVTPEQAVPTSTMVSAASFIATLKWVCKSALTLVGIGAWVTSVYYTGGMLLTVSNWVIRYVTVPTLLCNWL